MGRGGAARAAGRILTIDGPAGTGKSATARGVARRLRLVHLDSGALYRALAWAAEREGLLEADEARLGAWVTTVPLDVVARPGEFRVLLEGQEAGERLRGQAVGQAASRLATRPVVRERVTALMRAAASGRDCVVEGRDMGSVVFPDARPKIFLTASLEARTARRQAQLRAAGLPAELNEVRNEIEERDLRDGSRAVSPLRPAPDAVRIDTSDLTLAQQIDLVAAFQRGGGHYPGTRLFRGAQFGLRVFFLGICGARAVGRDLIPPGGCLLAANHREFADPLIVGCLLPGAATFMAKSELFHGLLGALLRRFNAMPVRRGTADRKALRAAERMLLHGIPMLIFPEGTRIRDGRMGNPHGGVAWLARRTGLPVVPVRVGGGSLRSSLLRRECQWVRFGPALAWAAADGRDDAAFAVRVMAAIAALEPPPGA